jgi:hypothetical protein
VLDAATTELNGRGLDDVVIVPTLLARVAATVWSATSARELGASLAETAIPCESTSNSWNAVESLASTAYRSRMRPGDFFPMADEGTEKSPAESVTVTATGFSANDVPTFCFASFAREGHS